mmetsp:Transcript_21958/g.47601  ORF Transcript_21958/g.47601 Transcript_21958/m.47601 type:complete len:180 (+) Transcript_21958:1469-2008(+)
MKVIFRHLETISSGLIYAQGQGLMWGALVSRKGIHSDESVRAKTVATLRKNLGLVGVLPYFVPVGGFMVSPVIDLDVGSLYKIAEKLEKALFLTVKKVGWEEQQFVPKAEFEIRVRLQLDAEFYANEVNKQCQSQLHFARTCTSCEDFVCPIVRKRFSQSLYELQSTANIVEAEEQKEC